MQSNVSDPRVARERGQRISLHALMHLATRVALFALVAVVMALMYQGERWMLQRSSTATDPTQIATCAFDAVEELHAACARALIQ